MQMLNVTLGCLLINGKFGCRLKESLQNVFSNLIDVVIDNVMVTNMANLMQIWGITLDYFSNGIGG